MDPLKLNLSRQILEPKDKKRVEEKKKSKAATTFEKFVEETRQTELDKSYTEEELGNLLEQVWQEGAALVQRPDTERMERYKKAVKSFVEAIVQMTYRAQTNKGILRKNGDRAVYTLVSVINEKLDGLGRAILQGQRDPLEILRRTDELKGLLINLKL